MPNYTQIDSEQESGRRTAAKLLELRAYLDSHGITERSFQDKLRLASWNIREFDSNKYGKRTTESMYYIAEIISRFDLVAVQEVRDDLVALRRLMRILGPWWDAIFTDVTKGGRGNAERMAFLFDKRKVRFGGLAGELVLPPKLNPGGGYTPKLQFARTPFIAGFKAGWLRFMISTVHIYYGQSVAEDPVRVEEIKDLAKFLKARASDPTAWSDELILLGDFNIFNVEDATFQALVDNGFVIPETIQNLPSNLGRNRHYDQIAFMMRRDMNIQEQAAGVVNFLDVVYTDADQETYIPEMGEAYEVKSNGEQRTEAQKRTYYKAWRTHQISDHIPLWVEFQIDLSGEYLEERAR